MKDLEDKKEDTMKVTCPCGCTEVIPILLQCEAEGHVFGYGMWAIKQLKDMNMNSNTNKNAVPCPKKGPETRTSKQAHGWNTLEQDILYAIQTMPGSTYNDLSRNVSATKASISGTLSKMHKKGIIKRNSDRPARYWFKDTAFTTEEIEEIRKKIRKNIKNGVDKAAENSTKNIKKKRTSAKKVKVAKVYNLTGKGIALSKMSLPDHILLTINDHTGLTSKEVREVLLLRKFPPKKVTQQTVSSRIAKMVKKGDLKMSKNKPAIYSIPTKGDKAFKKVEDRLKKIKALYSTHKKELMNKKKRSKDFKNSKTQRISRILIDSVAKKGLTVNQITTRYNKKYGENIKGTSAFLRAMMNTRYITRKRGEDDGIYRYKMEYEND